MLFKKTNICLITSVAAMVNVGPIACTPVTFNVVWVPDPVWFKKLTYVPELSSANVKLPWRVSVVPTRFIVIVWNETPPSLDTLYATAEVGNVEKLHIAVKSTDGRSIPADKNSLSRRLIVW